MKNIFILSIINFLCITSYGASGSGGGSKSSPKVEPPAKELMSSSATKQSEEYVVIDDAFATQLAQYIEPSDSAPQENFKLPFIPTMHGNVPKIFHFIWLGDKLPAEYLSNLLKWHKMYQPKGNEFIIWTDRKDHDFGIPEETENLHIINVSELNKYHWLNETYRLAYLIQTKRMNSNYGEASDLLRYILLYHFGGIYVDFDVPTTYLDHEKFEKTLPTEEKAQLIFYPENDPDNREHICNSDFIISPSNLDFFKGLVEDITHSYRMKKFFPEGYRCCIGYPEIGQTVFRTGPSALDRYIQNKPEAMMQSARVTHPAEFGVENIANDGSWSDRMQSFVSKEYLNFSQFKHFITIEIIHKLIINPNKTLEMKVLEKIFESKNGEGFKNIIEKLHECFPKLFYVGNKVDFEIIDDTLFNSFKNVFGLQDRIMPNATRLALWEQNSKRFNDLIKLYPDWTEENDKNFKFCSMGDFYQFAENDFFTQVELSINRKLRPYAFAFPKPRRLVGTTLERGGLIVDLSYHLKIKSDYLREEVMKIER